MASTIRGSDNFDSSNKLTAGTAQATTAGTSIDFTGIPSWVNRITLSLAGVSTNGVSQLQLQLGSASGGVETSGYAGGYLSGGATTVAGGTWTLGIPLTMGTRAATDLTNGVVVLTKVSGNTWVGTSSLVYSTSTYSGFSTGSKTLTSTLDRIRLTTQNGTDLFDAGSANILYE